LKTIYLNRHAKSSWDDSSLSDFERPLNKRGKRDAPFMADILSKKINPPEIIYSSPAKRASTTAAIIAEALGISFDKIIFDKTIYGAVVSDLMRIINNTDNSIERIMFFGHNPTFTMLSNYLSDKYLDNLPTSGFVQINFELNSWNDIEGNTGKLELFEYPKKYRK